MDIERTPLTPELSRGMARAAAGLSKQADVALNSVELSVSQYRVLSFLEDGSSESAALARRLAVRPPSVTSVVDGLVSRGLVERYQSSDDRRRVHHVLTDAGRQLLGQADAAVGARLEDIAACLDDADLAARAVEGLVLWRQAIIAWRQQAVRS